MMSLCFCPHCIAAGQAAGIDMDQLRQFVRAEMQRVFDGDKSALDDIPLDQTRIGSLLNGAVGQFIAVRAQVITSLTSELVAAVKLERNITVNFMDVWWTRRRVGHERGGRRPRPWRAWRDGVDFAAAAIGDSLSQLAYTSDLNQVSGSRTLTASYFPATMPTSWRCAPCRRTAILLPTLAALVR
jgi:hypothetical protein